MRLAARSSFSAFRFFLRHSSASRLKIPTRKMPEPQAGSKEPLVEERLPPEKGEVDDHFSQEPGRVVNCRLPSRVLILGAEEQLVDSADRLDGDDAEIVSPESERHLASDKIVSPQEPTDDVDVGLFDQELLGFQGTLE